MKEQIKRFFTRPILEKLFFIPIIHYLFRPFIPSNRLYSKGSFRKCTRNGINYELDLSEYVDHFVYFKGGYEERNLLYGSLKKGMIVIDIGANIGETALNFSQLVGDTGNVIAFEPVDTTFLKLQRNVSLNPGLNIKVYNYALSDKKEDLVFGYSWNQNSGGIGMRKTKSETETNVANAIMLDDFVDLHKIEKIDFIKIDVEGFEKYVLTGAVKMITNLKPLMYVEVSDQALKENNTSANDLIRFISSLNYQMTDVRSGAEVYTNRNYDGLHIDILCRPETTIN